MPTRLVIGVVAAVVVMGCAGDDPPDPAPPPPTTTAPSTTVDPEAADEQALRQLTEDWFAARSQVLHDGADPALAEDFVTGDYLNQFVEQVEEFRDSGQRLERGDDSREVIESIEVDGDEATVATCFVDADALFDADGELINDDVGRFRYATAAVATVRGWRFSERSEVEEEVDQCEG